MSVILKVNNMNVSETVVKLRAVIRITHTSGMKLDLFIFI